MDKLNELLLKLDTAYYFNNSVEANAIADEIRELFKENNE